MPTCYLVHEYCDRVCADRAGQLVRIFACSNAPGWTERNACRSC